MKADASQPKAVPELNLYNFEEDEFVGSKYVLTSPRSLEACDMLNVKPLQLIYKPLSDFQDEMRERGLTFQDAYMEYDRYEKDRQHKLRECRDYRDKMIRDNIFKSSEEVMPAYERGDVVSAEDYLGGRVAANGTRVGSGETTPSRWAHHTDRSLSNGVGLGQSTLTNGTSANQSPLINGHTPSRSAPSQSDVPSAEDKLGTWRTHPPYSERHLSQHTRSAPSANNHETSHAHSNGYRSRVADRQPLTDVQTTSNAYKSRFMREKLGLDGEPDGVKPLATSLPLHRDDVYKSAYSYHRRSYTTDGAGTGLNRTSTPYEGTTAKPRNDRSFSTISDVYSSNSPREETAPTQRGRTTSAYSSLERETSALRNLASRYEPRTDINMSRSLSLTDLHQPSEGYRQRYLQHRAGRHHRGYTSDEELTNTYRRRKETARTEDILARALDRRQREIEADLRQEELEYRHQVDALRGDLRELGVNEPRETLGDALESRRYRRSRDSGVAARHMTGHDRHATHRSTPQWYEDETLADKTQRERRVELARLQAVEELETARVLSQKSRLQSERVRKAFHEALAKNVGKWNRNESHRLEHNNNNEDDYDSYKHIENVLERSLGSDRSLSSSRERAYPRPTRAHNSPRTRPEARRSNGYDQKMEYEELRNSLRRNETYLTEEAVHTHNLISSLSPRDSEEFADLGALEETQERLRSLVNSPRRADDGRIVEPVANGLSNDLSDEYVKRPRKPTHDHRRERTRLKHDDQDLVEDRVREMKTALEERRRKLTDKLKKTDRETQELRAARLEIERKETDRRQERANRRLLKNSADNNKKKQTKPGGKIQPASRITEQQVKSSKPAAHALPRGRDTFDKKVLKAELNNWVNTGHRSQRSRSRSANRNRSQFTLT